MKAINLFILYLCCLFKPAIAGSQTIKIKDTLIQLYLLPQTLDSLSSLVQAKPPKINVADSLFAYAETFTGRHYKRGGSTVKGFDCSGYTMTVFKHFGIKLPHTSSGQSLVGIEIKRKQIRKGDLVFFKGRNSRRRGIGHVGIVISEPNEPVRFIHSSTGHGVRMDYLDGDYYKRRFVKATRVLPLP